MGRQASATAALNRKMDAQMKKIFNTFNLPMYKEKIQTIQPKMISLLKKQDTLFSHYVSNEKTAQYLAETLFNIVTHCIALLHSEKFNDIGLPVRDPNLFWSLLTDHTVEKNCVVNELFEFFLIKVNFALENKMVLQSAMDCGEIVTLILKNIDLVFPEIAKRYKVVLLLKKHVSLLCFYINKTQHMYRRRKTSEVVRLPGGMTVLPMCDLRIILADSLFSLAKADRNSGYEVLTKIYDSTYYLLFLFAMEKCHNNIFLSKFLEFLEIFFGHATDNTL